MENGGSRGGTPRTPRVPLGGIDFNSPEWERGGGRKAAEAPTAPAPARAAAAAAAAADAEKDRQRRRDVKRLRRERDALRIQLQANVKRNEALERRAVEAEGKLDALEGELEAVAARLYKAEGEADGARTLAALAVALAATLAKQREGAERTPLDALHDALADGSAPRPPRHPRRAVVLLPRWRPRSLLRALPAGLKLVMGVKGLVPSVTVGVRKPNYDPRG